jgi:acyl carrier protein
VTVATTEQLNQFLRGVIAELTGTDESEINGGDRLREDLGLDSLQNMELLSRVSEEFDIDPDMEEVMKVTTVDEVVAALTAVLD